MSVRAARDATLMLLDARAPGATLCPSEVARVVARENGAASAGGAWRDAMPQVHAAIDGLVAEGLVTLSWKGHGLPTRTGPYRIARRSPD